MSLNLRYFLYLPLIFLFLPAFALPIAGSTYLILYIILYAVILFLLIKDNKKILLKLIDVIRKTPLKLYILVLLLSIINMFVLMCFGKLSIYRFLISLIFTIGLKILPLVFYFIYIIGKYISLKDFIKTFLFLFWLNLLLGFVSYLGQFFNIQFIMDIFDFFANARKFAWEQSGLNLLSNVSNYSAFGLPRLDNLFQEPSEYAHYLCMFLPFVYTFSITKVKIYKNTYLNLLIKKTLIPFTILSIILTMSPIAFILCIVLTGLYFYKDLLKFAVKYYPLLIAVIVALIILLNNIDLSETYLSRIINVITNVRSIEDFILIEPSLGTRIISYINVMCIFFKYPLTGVGLGNIPYTMVNQLLNSPVPLTAELVSRNSLLTTAAKCAFFVNDYLYTFIAENGLFIFLIFAYFYYSLYRETTPFQNTRNNNINCFKYTVQKALNGTLISIFIISLYNLAAQSLIIPMYFVWALTISLIYLNKTGKDIYEKNNNNR